MLDFKDISKYLLFFGIAFVIGSVLEFITFYILMNISLHFESKTILLGDIIFTLGIIEFSKMICWIVLMIINLIYLLLGVLFIGLRLKKTMNNLVLAKYIIILGIFELVTSFTQLEYIVVIANTNITVGGISSTFNEIVLNPLISPYLMVACWIFYYAITGTYLFFGLFITAGAINWSNKISRNEN